MNRFEYLESKLYENENIIAKEHNTKIYHGNEKTQFVDGDLVLTTHRLIWGSHNEIANGSVQLCLRLIYVQSITDESGSYFTKKRRIICHLNEVLPNKAPGPIDNSNCDIHFIKLSSKSGIIEGFMRSLINTVEARVWTITITEDSQKEDRPKSIKLRTGIVGIERSIKNKQQETDQNIAKAFKDLDVLMKMAQDMVKVSKAISSKIKEKNVEITEDETITFKSYLMSLGIDDPVTRTNYQSNSEYYQHLAKEITEVLLDVIDKSDGMITLSEAYCRINRARCLEMLSTDDLLNACKHLQGPLKLRTFPSGTTILSLQYNDDEEIANNIENMLQDMDYITVENYAEKANISLLLAKERLLVAESFGKLCRDISIEGFRFYLNKFLL